MPVQHPRVGAGSFDPQWGVKEHTASVHVPPMTRTALSRNLGILAFGGNLIY